MSNIRFPRAKDGGLLLPVSMRALRPCVRVDRLAQAEKMELLFKKSLMPCTVLPMKAVKSKSVDQRASKDHSVIDRVRNDDNGKSAEHIERAQIQPGSCDEECARGTQHAWIVIQGEGDR